MPPVANSQGPQPRGQLGPPLIRRHRHVPRPVPGPGSAGLSRLGLGAKMEPLMGHLLGPSPLRMGPQRRPHAPSARTSSRQPVSLPVNMLAPAHTHPGAALRTCCWLGACPSPGSKRWEPQAGAPSGSRPRSRLPSTRTSQGRGLCLSPLQPWAACGRPLGTQLDGHQRARGAARPWWGGWPWSGERGRALGRKATA